ncbi:sulfide/dihydroorotate dehydrogenase-like FAD/NAD-binding protein [Enterococcus hirae]|jgi:ferredoxin--NADP+ reductase|nr:sulfide/dihydroorotate dehydrogenase-like FAD/NAD-binding protein [Enterococcaceae bacterium]MCI1920236.1 sulfide/dihydroorotate dehydrogenase-like FAD/NAD-binding protein [Enterococcaceae bacterium]MDM8212923.1 sulfide/dihydroorotate dehydrogenase-like FAD/NAD-binding protein [Enterococcus hirae]
MYKIVKNDVISNVDYDFWIEAPEIAKQAKPGQFVIIRSDKYAERIPLTIADTDLGKGLIRIIFQVVGESTAILAQYKAGEELLDVTGPLGTPTHIKKYGTVMMVGGGVGIAALYPIIKGIKEAGNRVITVLGARDKDAMILADECKKYSDELILMTDDGSLGEKGLVTNAMEKVFDREKIDMVWAVGPTIMMKFCSQLCDEKNVPCYVSLNSIMIDGTGMCGCCRVTVGDSIKFACVDGPEFFGHEVNWGEFMNRMGQYRPEEKEAMERFKEMQVNE